MLANDQPQVVKAQMLVFLTACESCKYLSRDVKKSFEKRLNEQDADICVVFRDFLKKHVAKNDELLGYFADYLAKVDHKEFANLFFKDNASLTLNLTIVPDLKNFNANNNQKSGYLLRGWQRFQTKHLKVNSPASEETGGREHYSITPFWRTNYAKEAREQLKVALLDLGTLADVKIEQSDRKLQDLKNDIYDIVFQYKENIRGSGAWFRNTGLARAQELQEAVALAENVHDIKTALSKCFNSYNTMWKSGISQDSLVACFAGNPSFNKNAEKELGIDVPNLLEQPIVKTCWASSCFRPNKVQPVVETNNFEALKEGFKGVGAVRN